MKYLFSYLVVFLLIVNVGNEVYAQDNAKTAVSQQVENKDFTFIANFVSPLRGQRRSLNDSYDVRIKKDSLVSYLPYFGVSQSAPLTNDASGIKFTSTNFDYKYEKGKKDSWNIRISFNDQSGTRQFNFTIFENGNATLDVTSTFRDPISFSGYLKK